MAFPLVVRLTERDPLSFSLRLLLGELCVRQHNRLGAQVMGHCYIQVLALVSVCAFLEITFI